MVKKDLFVVGELNVDLILNQIANFPRIGTEILAERMNLVLGSSSAIMAANASAMGLQTAFCGAVGADVFGDMVVDELQQKNIDCHFIKKSQVLQTGITVVMNYDQDRANVTYCGAMESLTMSDIPWGQVANYKHFHLSNFFLQKGIKKDISAIFKKAKSVGVTTSLDMQWDPEDQWDFNYKECLPYVDVFFPNESEILALTSTISLDDAFSEVSPYANVVALKLGETGSLGICSDEQTFVEAFKNPHFVDAIGAGDSFNAGFISRFILEKTLKDCLTVGNVMGALNTTASGGTAAFADPWSIERKVKEIFNIVL